MHTSPGSVIFKSNLSPSSFSAPFFSYVPRESAWMIWIFNFHILHSCNLSQGEEEKDKTWTTRRWQIALHFLLTSRTPANFQAPFVYARERKRVSIHPPFGYSPFLRESSSLTRCLFHGGIFCCAAKTLSDIIRHAAPPALFCCSFNLRGLILHFVKLLNSVQRSERVAWRLLNFCVLLWGCSSDEFYAKCFIIRTRKYLFLLPKNRLSKLLFQEDILYTILNVH